MILAHKNITHYWMRSILIIGMLTLGGLVSYIQLGFVSYSWMKFGGFERFSRAKIIALPQKGEKLRYIKLVSENDEIVKKIINNNNISSYELISDRKFPFFSVENRNSNEIFSPIIVETRNEGLSLPERLSEKAKSVLQNDFTVLATKEDAKKFNLGLGQKIKDKGMTVTIGGIIGGKFGAGESMISRHTVDLIEKNDNQSNSNNTKDEKKISTILISPKNGVDAKILSNEINSEIFPLGGASYVKEEYTKLIRQQALDQLDILKDYLTIALVICFVACVIVAQSIGTLVEQQRPEFGLLIALGIPKSQISILILEQSFWIGLISSAFAFSFSIIAKILLEFYGVKMLLPIIFFPLVSMFILLSSILGGLVSIPRVLKINPAELLR